MYIWHHFDPKNFRIFLPAGGCVKNPVFSQKLSASYATSTTNHVELAEKLRFQIRQQNVYIWQHFGEKKLKIKNLKEKKTIVLKGSNMSLIYKPHVYKNNA